MKKIIALILICCMVLPMIPASAIDNETVPCDFQEKIIIVTIHPDWYDYEYTVDDFSEIGCVHVHHSYDGEQEGRPVQKLHLTIEKEGKQAVLDAIATFGNKSGYLQRTGELYNSDRR